MHLQDGLSKAALLISLVVASGGCGAVVGKSSGPGAFGKTPEAVCRAAPEGSFPVSIDAPAAGRVPIRLKYELSSEFELNRICVGNDDTGAVVRLSEDQLRALARREEVVVELPCASAGCDVRTLLVMHDTIYRGQYKFVAENHRRLTRQGGTALNVRIFSSNDARPLYERPAMALTEVLRDAASAQ